MEKITDTSKLPDWFKNRIYRKQLSDIDWYREIRRRQYLSSTIKAFGKYLSHFSEDPDDIFKTLLEKDNIRPDSIIYFFYAQDCPIRELTVGEATFLAFSTQRSDVSNIVNKYNKVLELWVEVIKEMQTLGDKQRTPSLGLHERSLETFINYINDNEDCKLDIPIGQYWDRLKNPWLSYGRPLNGYPLTIDTQYDDETILEHVKLWLRNTRKKEGSKGRRPFNQNDFDDWEYYKIREIFDLQTWAILNETKILDRVIASALWPHEIDGFSPIDVLRTTARKKVKDIFKLETVVRLFGQLQFKHGENFLIK